MNFLKPDWRKIVLSVLIFLFLFIFGTPLCIDPSEEGLRMRPDPEYWGCHTQLHRYFHFIPDFFLLNWFILIKNPILSFLAFILTSYLLSCLIIWIYEKLKKKA